MARRKGQRTVKRGERRPSEAPPAPASSDAAELGLSSTVQAKDPLEGADHPHGDPESERAPDSVVAPETTPAPHRIGRYQLLFELARGGMGTVHVGRQVGAHGFDRLVAIKRLKAEGATAEDVDAFLAEARVTARLSHPNVVQTVDVGEHAGLPFLVMDLVEGVSLARLIRRLNKAGATLAPALAMWIAIRIAEGLHAAHELTNVDGEPYGLVHRDVSPENVLLSYDGQVFVVDFGVAKFAGTERHQTQSGVVKGKFAYMSPEQTEADTLDRRSDVFALGIVMHECLTGERLFAGRSVADTIRRIWQIDPPDPSEGRDDVPRELVDVVMACLEKGRDARTASAADVAERLRGIMRAETLSVDESDVVRLLTEHFAEDRKALQERIREAVKRADEEGPDTAASAELEDKELGVDPPPASRELGSVTASVTSAPAGVPTKGSPALPLVLGAALVGLGLLWWLDRDAASAGAPSETAASAPPDDTAGAAPTAPPGATPPVAPTPSTTASASASSVATASPSPPSATPPPMAPPVAPPVARPVAPPVAPPPPPAPKPESVKGVPFKSL